MKKGTLPFFLHVTDPLAIVVINGNLLVLRKPAGLTLYPYKALEFLFDINAVQDNDSKLSKLLSHHFESPELQGCLESSNCLIGIDEEYDPGALYLCLNCSLNIDQSEDTPQVILDSFSYNRESFDSKVVLTLDNAFMVFANLCVEHTFDTLLGAYKVSIDSVFSKECLAIITDDPHYIHLKPLFEFVSDYVTIINEEIQNGYLDLFDVLRLGGIETLMLNAGNLKIQRFIKNMKRRFLSDTNSLSDEEKILFLSFILCLKPYDDGSFFDSHPLFDDFAKLRNKILDELILISSSEPLDIDDI